MFDLSEKELVVVRSIIRSVLPNVEVWAYGSRVNGKSQLGGDRSQLGGDKSQLGGDKSQLGGDKSHPGSDLDLAVIGRQKDISKEIAQLRDAFEESSLTFSVDIQDWDRIPEEFKSNILKNHEVIQQI